MSLPTRSRFIASLAAPSIPLSDDWECAICQESEKNSVVTAHHNHAFCRPCLTAWLDKNTTCPMCRRTLCIPDPFPIPQPSNATIRRPDSQLLREIQTRDRYTTELRLNSRIRALLPYTLKKTLLRLRRRWNLYLRGSLTMDVEYQDPYILAEEDEEMEEDDENSPLVLLPSHLLAAAFFAHWFTRFRLVEEPQTQHHPLATGLLLAVLGALKNWDGQPRSRHSLEVMMRIRLGRGFDQQFPPQLYGRPDGWEEYREGLVEICGSIFECLIHGAGGLLDYEERALRRVEDHSVLWE